MLWVLIVYVEVPQYLLSTSRFGGLLLLLVLCDRLLLLYYISVLVWRRQTTLCIGLGWQRSFDFWTLGLGLMRSTSGAVGKKRAPTLRGEATANIFRKLLLLLLLLLLRLKINGNAPQTTAMRETATTRATTFESDSRRFAHNYSHAIAPHANTSPRRLTHRSAEEGPLFIEDGLSREGWQRQVWDEKLR